MTGTPMQVYVNGDVQEFAENTAVADLIAKLGLTGKRIAVELNKEILPHLVELPTKR